MEFPDLGQHCSYEYCKQLDFLPMKCDACSAIFCKDHITYSRHACSSSHKKDVQVPVCPLCNKPVPVARGELPDIKVGQHIDNDCQSDPAKAKRSERHRCASKGCRQVEFVPIVCSSCRKNFCLKHRNPLDHDCLGYDNSGRPISDAGAAAAARQQKSQQNSSFLNNVKTNISKVVHSNSSATAAAAVHNGASSSMSEDEALALAIQMSMNDVSGTTGDDKPLNRQEQDDRMLAEALARSEQDFAAEQQRQREMKKNCAVA